jgi:OOP family OmpA-OmpF porin
LVIISNLYIKFGKKITIKLFNLKIMNYSTLKKTVALSFASLMAVGVTNAQDSSTDAGSAKVFGGRSQYRTWNIGINGGVIAPISAFGGKNDYTNWDVDAGYGLSIRKQLGHTFGLQLSGLAGKTKGSNSKLPNGYQTWNNGNIPSITGGNNNIASFETTVDYDVALSGVINLGTVDFMTRKNVVNFYGSLGYGVMATRATVTAADGRSYFDNSIKNGKDAPEDSWGKGRVSTYIPVGMGVKFKLGEGVNLDLGYIAKFIDDNRFDGTYANSPKNDKASYGYAGLEFSLGSKSKPNLDWVNPVAMMYDELKDPSLRQEVEALKGRVSNVEKAVEDLKKDSDGDGVADQFDKCPNTPAGTVVDGSGCPLVLPKEEVSSETPGVYSNIQFEFDSSVLRTSSYPTLDRVSSELRSNSSWTLSLNGYASSEGTAAHNLRLSRDRANSVKTYLVNSGVDAKRIKTKGYGETNPIADNSTEEGRVLNRRVEFKTAM